ncbi:MAG: homocysteine S-methyltransferase family protein [Anaerolineaceae bacterium]|nr:homocysteine S-methyltransferase family protein [Anaerolineaceae bacterium]
MRREDIVLLDGAIGTSLWEKADEKVPVWRYNIENPAIVSELAREYVNAGSQIIHTNTFSANRPTLQRSDYTVQQVVSAAVRLSKEAIGNRAKVSLDVGPLPTLMEPYGDLTEEEAYEMFDEQISAGVAEKPDMITLETFTDADMLRIAVEAAAKHGLPIFTMMSFTEVGKSIMGHSVERFVDTVKDLPVTAIGLNCSLGPDKAVPIIASFRQYTDLPLIFKPNAGKPILLEDGSEKVQYDVDLFVEDCMPALDHDVKYIGGCCGSSPAYIRALRNKIFGQ